jgi:hypothetical protein
MVRSAIKGASMSETTAVDGVAGTTEPAKRRHRRIFTGKRVAAVVGVVLAGTGAYAASNWVVGLNSGSSGEAQSGSVNNLTITAVAAPPAGNLLFPGGTGDVVATISNPNGFPVTVTAVDLPASTTYAVGYTNSTLTTPNAGCTAATSFVGWTLSNATVGSVHTLTTPLTVAAQVSGTPGTLTVTFTDEASMGTASLAVCAATYFSMPSLTNVAATGGAAIATTSPVADGWTT